MSKLYIKKLFLVILFMSFFLVTSCMQKHHSSIEGVEDMFTNEEDILHKFSNGDSTQLFQKAFWSNGYPFDCRWSVESIEFIDDYMSVSLFEKDGTYYGGEYRSHHKYSYGYYSVCMKAAKCDGVISSFFTYTYRPWDEIDIEFLGNDTTKVQFNYYTNGVGNHEFHYDLGFDASEDFHEYGFYWTPDSITWYVDTKPVYRANVNIPSSDQQIMVNVWNVDPNVKEWAGLFDGSDLPVSAQYKWFAYKPYEGSN